MKRFLKFLFLILSVVTIIYFAVGYKLSKRNEISAVESYIVKDSIAIGTGEYGYITEVYQRVGAPVEKGEPLYGYIPLDEKNVSTSSLISPNSDFTVQLAAIPQDINLKLKKVNSPVKGILKQIYFPNGSYVTRDDKVMEVQLDSFLIRSTMKMEHKDFELLKSNRPVRITLPNGKQVGGHIVYIHPEYDFKKKEVIVDTSVDEQIDYLFDGTPVGVVLPKDDSMYLKYKNFNGKIAISFGKIGSFFEEKFTNIINSLTNKNK